MRSVFRRVVRLFSWVAAGSGDSSGGSSESVIFLRTRYTCIYEAQGLRRRIDNSSFNLEWGQGAKAATLGSGLTRAQMGDNIELLKSKLLCVVRRIHVT